MPFNQNRFTELFRAYLSGQITASDYKEFWLHSQHPDAEQLMRHELKQTWLTTNEQQASLPDEEWNSLMYILRNKLEPAQAGPIPTKSFSFRNRFKWVAAAAVMAAIFPVVYFFSSRNPSTVITKTHQQITTPNDRDPGGNKAVLVLSDGRQIVLDSSANGLLAMQGQTNIIKQKDGQITYNADGVTTNEIVYNTLSTPRGGQYKITLPDGSKVWLNASSSLKYPVVFAEKERKVEITGEAYFEVAKDAAHPFVVTAGEQKVEVLGTHFNINSYGDEEFVKTTLLEGKVKVLAKGRDNILAPGQQARLSAAGVMKISNNVDLEETIAWIDGNFQFEGKSIQNIMRQLARWYDIEVEYNGTFKKRFGGSISRNVPLSKVLTMLQQTGELKMTITGRKVVVEEL